MTWDWDGSVGIDVMWNRGKAYKVGSWRIKLV